MATQLKPVDVVLVGFGWTGAIMAQQLCDAGMNVLALEREMRVALAEASLTPPYVICCWPSSGAIRPCGMATPASQPC